MKLHLTIFLHFFLFSSSSLYADQLYSLEKMFTEGDYEGVLENISLKKYQSSNEQYYMAATSAFRLHRYEEALNYFRKIENLTRQFPDLHYKIAQIHYSLNELKESATYFQKSFDIKYKQDACLYYLGSIYKELGLYNKAKDFFAQIHQVSFPELSFIQAAHHQTGLLYLKGYTQTNKLSKKVLKEKVLPLFERAIISAPDLPLVEIIKQDINFIKNAFLQESQQPFSLYFKQFFNYNSNVIYQSIEPTELHNSASGLLDSLLESNVVFDIGSDFELEDRLNISFGHQYHLTQDQPTISRYDGFNINVLNQIRVNKPFKNYYSPIWFNIGYQYQNMNNNLSGELVFDNRNYNIGFGQQFSIFGVKPSYELKYTNFKNFSEFNNQQNYSLTVNLPLNFHQYLIFFLSSEIKYSDYENLTDLTNLQINNSLTHILQLTDHQRITSRGILGITDTMEMMDSRGYEFLISGQIIYDFKINNYFTMGLNYKYERKISKDKATFGYDQHLGGFSLEVSYE